MISKTQKYKYQNQIEEATKTWILFPNMYNLGNKPKITSQAHLLLPSQYAFKQSQQIDNHASSKNTIHNIYTQLIFDWPHSYIGLVLCQHHQNNLIQYVYGTGILIHNKIVLTSAQNLYCRRLRKEYINIKFITGVSGNKCSGIYDVMRVHYPMQYTKEEGYEQYNFAVLQLYDDLSDSCGYVGWKTNQKIDNKLISLYEYIRDNQQRSFKFRQITIQQKLQLNKGQFSGSGILTKDEQNYQYLVGIYNKGYQSLSKTMRDMINQWTTLKRLNLNKKLRGVCSQIATHKLNLRQLHSQVDVQIGDQGCKSLSEANWINLSTIYLDWNLISVEGLKYLSHSNWIHLTTLELGYNNISTQGCKFLSQAKWIHLTKINLYGNTIGTEGCKYINQANWTHITDINLARNNIGSQGCKYLSRINWIYLSKINLSSNSIISQGCKYLSEANWKRCAIIQLQFNRIENLINQILLKELWSNIKF